MIERLAQVIARAYGGSLYPELGEIGDYPTDEVDYRAARAVLTALREPTPEMLHAAAPWPEHWNRDNPALAGAVCIDQMTARDTWQAMLSAAMNEGEG